MIPPTRDGQGHQFHCPQSILSDALLWYGSQLGATPGGGSSFAAVRKHPQSSQRSSEHHKPPVPWAALWTATSLRSSSYGRQAIYASLQQPVDFFCKEIVPGQHRWEAPLLVDGSELIVERPRTARNGLPSLNRFPLA